MKAFYERRYTDFTFENTNAYQTRNLYCHPHTHHHIEMVYIKNGSVRAFADLKEYDLGPDDFFVSFPNQVHYYSNQNTSTNEQHSFTLAIISPDFIPDFDKLYGEKVPSSALVKNISRFPSMKAILDLLSVEHSVRRPKRENVLKGLWYAFFAELYLHCTFVEQDTSANNSIKAIINYCSNNYMDRLTLETVEQELHLNRYYISHLFKEKLKIGFTEYVNYLRTSEACKLLSDTDMSIASVGETVGFSTTRSFNRAFLKAYGISPGEYRRSSTPS